MKSTLHQGVLFRKKWDNFTVHTRTYLLSWDLITYQTRSWDLHACFSGIPVLRILEIAGDAFDVCDSGAEAVRREQGGSDGGVLMGNRILFFPWGLVLVQ